ncbi:LysR family transcriptional regulator [Vibrio sonorensis]|uniref:LysR family transcriptional regulator n=1 Tax=Vibrio sonorensis TaxID=1004316 RepID=UPI0008D9D0E3|nr:LysR family transcriptional regulator [Vibrio sonorensis]
MINFSNLDLNLLKLFVSLYQTGSVTQTAEALNLSQSACSHALTRLRERLNDELFVRVDNQMLPSEYANQLAADIVPAFNAIKNGIETSHPFTASDKHTFRIAVTDYTSWCMRKFVAYLSRQFPSVDIEFVQLEQRLPELALKEGEVDLVCGFAHQQESSEALSSLIWLTDSYVSARCQSHPEQGDLQLEAFLYYQHILVTPWNESRGIIDLSLAKVKKKRDIALKMNSVLAAAHFLPDTTYLLSMPSLYASHISSRLPILLSDLPLQVPDYQLKLYWHKTRDKSDKLNWFIDEFSRFHQC